MGLLIAVFVIGYLAIVAEHPLKINKTAPALLTGVLCWVIYGFIAGDFHKVAEEIEVHLSEVSGILFFLLGAMTIVELIDMHDGFDIITDRITSRNPVKLLWILSTLAFFLSAVLDNLTTTIVLVSLLRKLVGSREERLFYCGMIVIAANAGGAWSPIGDVTTTMLWLNGRISTGNIIESLFLPSLFSLVIPLIYVSFRMKGMVIKPIEKDQTKDRAKGSRIVLAIGLLALIFVPVFKTLTHLPPYMGILFGLGALWVIIDIIHKETENYKEFSVVSALARIDVPSVLFFFGILIAVSALQSAGLLHQLSVALDNTIGNKDIIVMSIGALSAIIDNVPLVAAAMHMYDLAQFPMDAKIWEFLAYAAGTGGSILIIGSAAGVAAMGMENINFMWYVRNISFIAIIGYLAGCFSYIGIYYLMH